MDPAKPSYNHSNTMIGATSGNTTILINWYVHLTDWKSMETYTGAITNAHTDKQRPTGRIPQKRCLWDHQQGENKILFIFKFIFFYLEFQV